MLSIELDGQRPRVSPSTWIATNATLAGAVIVHDDVGVFYGAVLRAELSYIEIGAGSNVQDNVVAHAGVDAPVQLGERVTVGHGAILHGCAIGADTLVGMGAIIMNHANIGSLCLIAAGALVPEGFEAPDRSLIIGAPAAVRRELTENEIEGLRANSRIYADFIDQHRRGADLSG